MQEVTGGKQSGSETQHVRAGTVNIHKPKAKSERTQKDIQSLREQELLHNIRQNNLRKKTNTRHKIHCEMRKG